MYRDQPFGYREALLESRKFMELEAQRQVSPQVQENNKKYQPYVEPIEPRRQRAPRQQNRGN